MRQALAKASIGVWAGILAGLLPGLMARLAMRVVALAAGNTPTFNFGVTFVIIVLPAVLIGSTLGVLYIGLRDYLPKTNSRLVQGLLYGLFIFVIFGAPFFLLDSEFTRDIRLSPVLGRIMFFTIPFLYSVPLVYVVDWLEAKHIFHSERMTKLEIARALILIPVLGLSLLIFTLFMSTTLTNAATVVGVPIRGMLNGRMPDISLEFIVGLLLILTYPALVLTMLYLLLRRYLFAANWIRGLLIGLIASGLLGCMAFMSIQADSSSALVRRAPQTGLVVLCVLFILYGASLPMMQPTPAPESVTQVSVLSRTTKGVIFGVVVTEIFLLLASVLGM
jgi:hypothetical protein